MVAAVLTCNCEVDSHALTSQTSMRQAGLYSNNESSAMMLLGITLAGICRVQLSA